MTQNAEPNTPRIVLRPDLVDLAMSNLYEWSGHEPLGTWEVVSERRHLNSTIVLLDVPTRSGPVARLVYKLRLSDRDLAWYDRNLETVNQAVLRLRTAGLDGAPILAADPLEQLVVTLYLDGSVLRPPAVTQRRLTRREAEIYEAIGRAARVIESDSQPAGRWVDVEREWNAFESRIGYARFDPSLEAHLLQVARAVFDEAVAEPANVVLAHSEMAFNNIVVTESRVGLIDLNFVATLRGYTIARFLHRLRASSHLRPRAAMEAEERLLGGYGIDTSDASHRFMTLQRLTYALGPASGVRVLSPRRRRVVGMLRSLE